MSNAIACLSGYGKGKYYHRGPNGRIALVASATVNKAKSAAGWRLATQTEIDSMTAAEVARKNDEAKTNAPAHVDRTREAAAQASMAAKTAAQKEARNARDPG